MRRVKRKERSEEGGGLAGREKLSRLNEAGYDGKGEIDKGAEGTHDWTTEALVRVGSYRLSY